MRTYSAKTIPILIRRSVFQSLTIGIFAAFLLSFVYGLVYYYQQKYSHTQLLAALLADGASTADRASLVAKQARIALDNDPTLSNIIFYSTDYPISQLKQAANAQTTNDWYNALFADTVSFNYMVTSRYITSSMSQATNNSQSTSADSSRALTGNTTDSQLSERNTLVGYIHITLDVAALRMQWLRKNIFLWLITVVLAIISVLILVRKLNWPSRDIAELAEVCDIVFNNPKLEKLPVIHQHFKFQELDLVRKTFITLFSRLRVAQQKADDLAIFEQQLHDKDRYLEVQRHNFQSMITHELKTSLNAISGGLQLLDNHHLNYDQQDTLAIIRKSSQHLELTLEQIIQLNRIEKGQIVVNLIEFSPLQMIADLLAEFDPIAKQKGLELLSHTHHIDYTLEGDASKIQQILSTLIDNAIKFTQEGQVTIESQLTHFNNSIRWQLKVIDTGIGINPDYIDDIFTPFFQIDSSKTREYEGAGVGLPVVKQMLQLIGASIEVDSKLGAGSQFTVIIPLRNKYKGWQQTLLEGLDIIYCHADENDFLAKELQRLGATVIYQQYEQLMIEQLTNKKFDIVMFAEDILPKKVAQLARAIREHETTHRALLVYWYPARSRHDLYGLEHELKIAGIDYCQSVTQKPEKLIKLLKRWTGRS